MPSLVSQVFADHFLLALKMKIHGVNHVLAKRMDKYV